MLKYPVYVRNITNLSDARYCAGMGVEMLGFCFDESSKINQTQFEAIKGWIAGVKFVAEFYNSSLDFIKKVVENINPDFLLLDAKNFSWASEFNIPIIFYLSLESSLIDDIPKKSYLLILPENNDISLTKHHQLLKKIKVEYAHKLFISYGFNKNNIVEIFENYQPFGLSLLGEDELTPGLKNFDHLSEILEAIEI